MSDNHQDDDEKPIDEKRRQFLLAATSTVGAVGVAAAATPFLSSWLPSERAKAAGAPVQVDISQLLPGIMMTVAWRGKPVWILHRTKAQLQALSGHDESLRDPNSKVHQQPDYATNVHRSIRPEILVLIGICTHLGCSPKYTPESTELGPNWPGGFYCPCHGSTFDLAGRVFEGVPAPINLQVPPYRFETDNTIVIGEEPKEA